jgi:ABC-type thiamine transport system substrate-binding protein
MKYIIKDVNKIDVLNTEDVDEAYKYLKKHVNDSEHLLSIDRIKNAINYDKNYAKKPQSCFGFYADKEQKEYISLEVFWDE